MPDLRTRLATYGITSLELPRIQDGKVESPPGSTLDNAAPIQVAMRYRSMRAVSHRPPTMYEPPPMSNMLAPPSC
jgi:hypothetical protein